MFHGSAEVIQRIVPCIETICAGREVGAAGFPVIVIAVRLCAERVEGGFQTGVKEVDLTAGTAIPCAVCAGVVALTFHILIIVFVI